MPILSEQKEDRQVLAPMFTSLQKKVVQRAERGEYRSLWLAIIGGTLFGVAVIVLAHFAK